MVRPVLNILYIYELICRKTFTINENSNKNCVPVARILFLNKRAVKKVPKSAYLRYF